MDDLTPPDGITSVDWAATPPAVRQFIGVLLQVLSLQQQQLADQQQHILLLQARIAELEARVNQHSKTPPNHLPPTHPPRRHAPRVCRAVATLAPSLVIPITSARTHPLSRSPRCMTIIRSIARPVRAPCLSGVTMPVPCARSLSGSCPSSSLRSRHISTIRCVAPTAATSPPPRDRRTCRPAAPRGYPGPRTAAAIAVLHGDYHLSDRLVPHLLHEFFGLPLSVGSVVDMQQTASAALKPVYETIHTAVQQQDRCNLDETSWKEAGKRRWLWTMVTTIATVFLVSTSRSGPALRQLLGECYAGIMTSDRHRPYLKQPPERHQVCWSHLIRNFQALVDRGGRPGIWGADFLELSRVVFRLWHLYREGTIDRATLQAAMAPVQTAFHALLERGARRADAPEALCQELLAHEAAPWTFVREERVEPTGYPLGERRRTGAARRGDLAQELFRRAQRGREPLCRTDLDGERDLSEATTTSVDLRDGGDCRILGRTPSSDPAIHHSVCPSVNGYLF
jgi:hypothetical protein